LFALEAALFALLAAGGVRPDFLLGHSVGEVVAAYAAGVLSLPDTCRLVAARGPVDGGAAPGGAMAAIEAGETDVASLLTVGVSVAAINTPQSLVVSGEEDDVERLVEEMARRGRRTRRLRVPTLFIRRGWNRCWPSSNGSWRR
jgi:acyl transferase domain-containing protein